MSGAAVLLCGHGSRDPDAVAEFASVAAALRARLAPRDVATAHLEFAAPTIDDGLRLLAAHGARCIAVLPAMLAGASHVRNDLPREIDRFSASNPAIDVRLASDLGGDGGVLDAAADRIAEAAPCRRRGALLLVVGRGARDDDANAATVAAARRLADRLGFAGSRVAFAGISRPSVDEGLAQAAASGAERVIVFPYLLFGGVLVKRIHARGETAAARYPRTAFATARHLGAHPAIIEALARRAAECESAVA